MYNRIDREQRSQSENAICDGMLVDKFTLIQNKIPICVCCYYRYSGSSQFFKPPRERKIGLKNLEIWKNNLDKFLLTFLSYDQDGSSENQDTKKQGVCDGFLKYYSPVELLVLPISHPHLVWQSHKQNINQLSYRINLCN